MARKRSKQRRKRGGSEESAEPLVVVCRGGDCGSRRKHPEVDHQAQLAAIREGVGAGASVVVSRCLDACDHSNVVVVLPGSAGRDFAEPVWVGEVNDQATTAEVIEWVQQGGPGIVDPPVLVDIKHFTPTRSNRHELDEETGA